jgi:hypothetical protein
MAQGGQPLGASPSMATGRNADRLQAMTRRGLQTPMALHLFAPPHGDSICMIAEMSPESLPVLFQSNFFFFIYRLSGCTTTRLAVWRAVDIHTAFYPSMPMPCQLPQRARLDAKSDNNQTLRRGKHPLCAPSFIDRLQRPTAACAGTTRPETRRREDSSHIHRRPVSGDTDPIPRGLLGVHTSLTRSLVPLHHHHVSPSACIEPRRYCAGRRLLVEAC